MARLATGLTNRLVEKSLDKIHEYLSRELSRVLLEIRSAINQNMGSVANVTSSYTVLPGVQYVFADASDGAFEVTLPAPTAQMLIHVKKTDSSGNAVTVVGEIDGAASVALTAQYDSVSLKSNESDEWYILGAV